MKQCTAHSSVFNALLLNNKIALVVDFPFHMEHSQISYICGNFFVNYLAKAWWISCYVCYCNVLKHYPRRLSTGLLEVLPSKEFRLTLVDIINTTILFVHHINAVMELTC